MPTLRVRSGPVEPQELDFDGTIIIGRASGADFHLDHNLVSRQHARIRLGEEGWVVSDLSSGNGTYLNRSTERLVGEQPLSDGDTLRVGKVVLEFTGGDASSKWKEESSIIQLREGLAGERDQVLERVRPEEAVSALIQIPGRKGGGERLQVMYDVSQAMGRTLEEDALLPLILEKLFEVFPQAERGAVLLSSDHEANLLPRFARTRTGEIEEISLSRTVLKEVVESRAGVLTADATQDDRFSGAATVHQLQLRSVVCVPMIAEGELYGVIYVDGSDSRRPFSQDDMALMVGIGGQAALALANSRLHRTLLKQELLMQDLELANRIQQSFLPNSTPEIEGYAFWDDYSPALEVGGDYYSFLDLEDGCLGIAVGDVSGKGVSAALYMAHLSSEMRYQSAGLNDPGEILRRLNVALCRESEAGLFVTLVLCVLQLPTRRMAVASAGHLPLFVKAPSGVVRLDVPTNVPLAIDETMDFDVAVFQLDPEDTVVAYTDGVTEADDGTGKLFGEDSLSSVLNGCGSTPREVSAAVMKAVRAHFGQAPQNDDVTLICFGPMG